MHLRLDRRTELALRGLRELRERGSTTSGADLAEAITTTAAYLPQVMAPLVAAGWVLSERGPNGGYTLSVTAPVPSMRALIEAVEGPLPPDQCVMRDGACSRTERCALHDSWGGVVASLINELDRINVFDTEE